MKKGKFATALNCIDGRFQEPLIKFAQEKLKIDFLDLITEPGIDGIFAKKNKKELKKIKEKILISIKAHHSRNIILAGHAQCAKNPVSEREHKDQIIKGVKIIKSWKLNCKVFGVWMNENFEIEILT